ncbi:MAG: hypothetical protein MUC31_01525 [Bacteroidales bacterium]|jgi:hypothetical protein|nr:hypothetical protein [Bacteroidales bacterium]
MNNSSKLRWSIGIYYPIVIFLSYIFAILELLFRRTLRESGIETEAVPLLVYILVGVFFVIMGIIQWFKYRLWIYPALGAILGALCTEASFIFDHHNPVMKYIYFITFFIMVLFIVLHWNAFYSQERFELNSRRLFRLASELISETGNGFTERPYTAGQVEFTEEDIQGFARFINGKYIAKPFHLPGKTVFAISMNNSVARLDEPGDVSQVTFDSHRNVTVILSARDYRDYTAKYNFDKLCDAMGKIFIRFLQYYRQGYENRIITELKSAR